MKDPSETIHILSGEHTPVEHSRCILNLQRGDGAHTEGGTCGSTTDMRKTLPAWSQLDEILLGNSAAPLQVAACMKAQ